MKLRSKLFPNRVFDSRLVNQSQLLSISHRRWPTKTIHSGRTSTLRTFICRFHSIIIKMNSRKETEKAPSQKACRKNRLLNEGDSLEDFVLKLNGSDPPACNTKEVDLTKCKSNAVFLAEFVYKEFRIRQLVKNNIETHYGTCNICNATKGIFM